MPFRPDRPYNDLPALPPKEDVETKAVLKACIAARAALAELKVAGELIPNQILPAENRVRAIEPKEPHKEHA